MEAEGSAPYSQELSTGPYPEPYQSNPHHPIISLYTPLIGNLLLLGLFITLIVFRIAIKNNQFY
jgi:hypothetical protein